MKTKEEMRQAVISATPREQATFFVRQLILDTERDPRKLQIAIIALMRRAYAQGMLSIVNDPTDQTMPAVRFERWLDADTTKGSVN